MHRQRKAWHSERAFQKNLTTRSFRVYIPSAAGNDPGIEVTKLLVRRRQSVRPKKEILV